MTAMGLGSNTDWGTKIPQAAKHGKKKKKKVGHNTCARTKTGHF